MKVAASMIKTHPNPAQASDTLAACISACFDCAQACAACADACLGESQVQNLVRCIRRNLDCAAVCESTGYLLSRQTQRDPKLLAAQVEVCRLACEMCGSECEQHAQMHEHCKVCAQACRDCQQRCETVLSEIR